MPHILPPKEPLANNYIAFVSPQEQKEEVKMYVARFAYPPKGAKIKGFHITSSGDYYTLIDCKGAFTRYFLRGFILGIALVALVIIIYLLVR